jgi:hypothetical protein
MISANTKGFSGVIRPIGVLRNPNLQTEFAHRNRGVSGHLIEFVGPTIGFAFSEGRSVHAHFPLIVLVVAIVGELQRGQ